MKAYQVINPMHIGDSDNIYFCRSFAEEIARSKTLAFHSESARLQRFYALDAQFKVRELDIK